jgi:Wiskott-Aldrich syndrome protein
MPSPPPPAAAEGRAGLLASIQGKGIHVLKPTSTGGDIASKAVSSPAPQTEVEDPAAGDITSALARALTERNRRMGGSDDEDSDDDSWE